MSTYEIDDLIQLWKFGKISPEQAIGQLMVHLQKLSQKVHELERDRALGPQQSKSYVEEES